ncbi:MAG TPA: alpha/beta fold hydrolase [Vicinamibacterales bacterium]|nr:alpha/beta fold hydrolase [Vicinamibacterales bacterium]
MRLTHCIAGGLALLTVAMPVQAQVKVVGDWHGVLQSPVGSMTLILTIAEGENGGLRGEMESVDQGSQKVPLTTLTVNGGHLAFTVRPAQIAYEGEWVEAEEHWAGVFTQGRRTPLTFRRGLPAARPVIEGLDGVWEGAVTRNGVGLRLLLRVVTSERGTIVTFDSPDLGAFGLPVAGFSRRAQSVGFSVPASGARFAGTLSDDGARLSGIWTLPGQPDVDLALSRTRATVQREPRARPQTPRPPFPYRAEDVAFSNPAANGVILAGTLTLPEGTGPFPAAVLITGSGPQDRDETLLGHKPFAVLADHLTRNGVAVLRYDDRGVGRSTGEFAAATSADFATDAVAAVRFLLTRPEIDREAIGLVGHSEGGMVAPIAAADNDHVRFVILLAGPGTSLMQLAQTQQRLLGLSQGSSEEELARMEPVLAEVFAGVATSASAEDARARVRAVLTADALKTLKAPESMRELMVERLANDWFRYFLRYTPAAALSRIRVPVLAINGTLDRQVPADENLAAIGAALAHNPDVTIRKLDGLNHLFQTAGTGAIGEYADIAETMSTVVLGIVTEWIGVRFKGHATAVR